MTQPRRSAQAPGPRATEILFGTVAIALSWATPAIAVPHEAGRLRDWSVGLAVSPGVPPSLNATFLLPLQSHQGLVLALIGFVLVASLLHATVSVAFGGGVKIATPPREDHAPRPDTRHSCQLLFAHLETVHREAEKAVMRLTPGSPLQSLLLGELNQVARQLQMVPDQFQTGQTALSATEHPVYWRNLARRLRAAIRDLNRVCEVATAGGITFGQEESGPSIPRTLDEAYLVIGANRDVDADILKRLVRALRQCWHPDLAHNEQDRRYREARIRQINVAVELISGRRSET